MYEPKYIPRLTSETAEIPSIRFELRLAKKDTEIYDTLHIHNELEIFINLSERVSFWVNDKMYFVENGDVIISRPGDLHMCIFPESSAGEHICLWLSADASSPVFSFIYKDGFSPLITPENKEELLLSVKNLRRICQSGESELGKALLMLEILSALDRSEKSITPSVDHPEAFQRIITDIQQNFASIKSVTDITCRNFISSSTLTRWFERYMHTSPGKYLESVRLSNAVSLLKSGCSVTDACFRSGFSDCSHFIALFKKHFGKTPLQYKRER